MRRRGTMQKKELVKKIKRDSMWDVIMSYVSLAIVVATLATHTYLGTNLMWIYIAGLHFLLWFNSYLLTQRDLQILEVEE